MIGILYLLTAETYSALHLLKTDEVYHFYRGDTVELTLLDRPGSLRVVTLGPLFETGQHCQFLVPAGTWQGLRLSAGGLWALMGTSTAPGFAYADRQLADRQLLEDYPEHARAIEALLPESARRCDQDHRPA